MLLLIRSRGQFFEQLIKLTTTVKLLNGGMAFTNFPFSFYVKKILSIQLFCFCADYSHLATHIITDKNILPGNGKVHKCQT